ncbi:Mannose-6-phosphate isomerase, cupin superfamily [Streptomyces zhaozhouensis]|uniref:Mannose-6-phosphate isomerase, cupin superfamily n=1 Tax=Streptomyces zhaozhouensis TaxID=1300267 RepID=A0A286DZN1_9ACTN|nr:cupin domain-containing protein [Streptomyces zhaozhouensis]SOD64116.1 Mannose-6-phosphate isomerase, cupin superfamily [Streptomyces zhaozhouensis]
MDVRARRGRWAAVPVVLAAVWGLAAVPSSAAETAAGTSATAGDPPRVAAAGGEPIVEPLTEGFAPEGVAIDAEGPTDVVQKVITIPPGGTTGWHTHQGPLLGVIESGTLTRTLDDCSVEVSGPGDALVEPHGADHAHVGRNLGDEPVVLYATYVLPHGAPLSEPAEDPGCPE